MTGAGWIGRLVVWGVVGGGVGMTMGAEPASGPVRAEPAEEVVRQARAVRGMAWGRAMSMPEGGVYELDDLVRVTMLAGRLGADCRGPMVSSQRVAVAGSDATWTYSRERTSIWDTGSGRWGGGGWGGWGGRWAAGQPLGVIETSGGEVWRLTRVASDVAVDEPQQVTLTGTGGAVQLEVLTTFRGGLERAVLSQMNDGVFFDEMPANQRRGQRMALVRGRILRGAGLFALEDQDPEAFAALVRRPLELMGAGHLARPGWTEVYKRFGGIMPDARAAGRVREIVGSLDAASPEARDAASAALEELGRAGVLAAMRMDSAGLSAEQRARVGAFLAAHDHGAAASGRSDRALLIDCLEVEDAGVRAAARKELGVGEDVTAMALRRALVAGAATKPRGGKSE